MHKLIAWHYAGYPDCGPFSKPPVEQEEEEPQEGGRLQPGPGQRPPSRNQRQIESLTIQLRAMTEHVAELEAGRELREPEPVALISDDTTTHSVDYVVQWVVSHVESKADLLQVIDALDTVYHDDTIYADADADADADTLTLTLKKPVTRLKKTTSLMWSKLSPASTRTTRRQSAS